MIVKILTKSRNFSAVDYNEKKVRQGRADLLEMTNFGYLNGSENITSASLKDYLIRYSARNENITYPQFHVSISCKGHEYTPEQLVDIAHQWLKEMGYGEEGQPLLIYSHHDTQNTHIHIVTSRIAPDGHKINHSNERRRSQAIINRIMGVDREQETKDVMKNAFLYSFATLGQYMAILESSGYEVFKDDEVLNIKKDGMVLEHLPINEIESHFTKLDKKETLKRRKQLKAILKKYRDLSSNKTELKTTLRSKFGLDLIFNGPKDAPHGYNLVDHKNRIVYKGSEVFDVRELLKFDTSTEMTPENILNMIKMQLDDQPDISTFEMSQLLQKKFNAYITTGEEFTSKDKKKSGTIVMGHRSFLLDQDIYDKLRMNGKVKWVQKFHPASEAEKGVLLKFGHIEDAAKLHVENSTNRKAIEATLLKLNSILSTEGSIFEQFKQEKLILYRQEEKFFILDLKNISIVDLDKEGVDTTRLRRVAANYQHSQGYSEGQQHTSGKGAEQALTRGAKNAARRIADTRGSRGVNREWEVGNNGRWDDVDDDRTLKR